MARPLIAFMSAMAQPRPVNPESHRCMVAACASNRGHTSLGRGAAPVWCPPRPREEAVRTPRPEREAGTRRRPVRWYPTHGYQQDQPSCLTGSASADRCGEHPQADEKKVLPTLDIGSHINATNQPRLEAGARDGRRL